MTKRTIFILLAILTLFLAACGGAAADTAVSAPVAEIDVTMLAPDVDVQTVAAVKDRDDVLVLDVREQWEYDEGHIPNITLIPMGEIPNRLDEIPTDKEVIITCRSGNRSNQIATFLRDQGYTNIHNMQGGILDWEAAGLPVDK
ncbi:MAG: rhodanese-like domain-containing protein [Chloroflexi bacterium]|nr:rhodanese-like domain-containing protein [Chloroflexota bacterium]